MWEDSLPHGETSRWQPDLPFKMLLLQALQLQTQPRDLRRSPGWILLQAPLPAAVQEQRKLRRGLRTQTVQRALDQQGFRNHHKNVVKMSPASNPGLTSHRPDTRLALGRSPITHTFKMSRNTGQKNDRPNTIKQKSHEYPFNYFTFSLNLWPKVFSDKGRATVNVLIFYLFIIIRFLFLKFCTILCII